MINLLQAIANHVLGKKYYCVTMSKVEFSNENPNQTEKRNISNYIFTNKEDALQYFYSSKSMRTFQPIEIVTFRSRQKYAPHDNGWKL